MDHKASKSPADQPVTTIFRFLPSGPPTEATKKAIRSHVMLEAKRKQRQQKILNLGAQKPANVSPATFEDSLCRCFSLPTPPSLNFYQTSQPNLAKSRSVAKRQEAADSYKICLRCHKVQLDRLSLQGQSKLTRWHTGIAQFIGCGCDPFLSTPKLPYTLSAAQFHCFNELKIQVITFFTPGILKTVLLPVAVKNSAVLMSLLYYAAAMLGAVQGENEPSPLARAIKREAAHQILLQLNDSDPKIRFSPELIPAIGFLSSGIWIFSGGDISPEDEELERGTAMLVKGGWSHHESPHYTKSTLSQPHNLPFPGPSWDPPKSDRLSTALMPLFALYKLFRASILLEPVEADLLATFGQPLRPDIANTVTESPLYTGRGDFIGLSTCRSCSPATLRLLRSVRTLIDTVLSIENGFGPFHDEEVLKHDSVRAAVAALFTEANPEVKLRGDSIYESCRMTAVIMATAIGTQTLFRDLDERFWEDLKKAMESTDIGNNWGPMMSVLLWVSLVSASAGIDIPPYRYLDSVARRVTIEITYRTPDIGAVAVAIQRFGKVQGLLERVAESRKNLELKNEYMEGMSVG